jgi:hypothetical protein
VAVGGRPTRSGLPAQFSAWDGAPLLATLTLRFVRWVDWDLVARGCGQVEPLALEHFHAVDEHRPVVGPVFHHVRHSERAEEVDDLRQWGERLAQPLDRGSVGLSRQSVNHQLGLLVLQAQALPCRIVGT